MTSLPAILNLLACVASRRWFLSDPLSTAWARSQGLRMADLHALVGPGGTGEPEDMWEARSIGVRHGRFVPDHAASDPVAWTDGPRLALSARIGERARIRGGWLILEEELPETVLALLPGARTSAVIALPFAFDGIVREVRPTDEGVQIGFDHEWTRIPKW